MSETAGAGSTALFTLRFRGKVMLGFALVVLISTISLGIAYFGYERVSAEVAAYRQSVAEADLARSIDRDVISYRALAKYYVVTGSDDDALAAQAAEASLKAAIEAAEHSSAKQARRDSLRTLGTEFNKFAATFADIVRTKRDNADLVKNQLTRNANLLRYKLDDVASNAAEEQEAAVEFGIKQVTSQLQAASALANNFVVNNDRSIAASALARLKFVENSLRAVAATDREKIVAGLKEAQALLAAYREALARIMDNVRTIEELVTEMSGSAGAIMQGAATMKADLVSEQQRLEARSDEIIGRTERMILMLAFGGVLLSSVLALVLGNGISRPMIRMSRAMRELADGNFEVVLPGLGRRDEIGDMAAAVEAFKLQAVAKAEREAAANEAQDRAAREARRAELIRFADEFESAVGAIVTNVSSSAAQLEQAANLLTRTAESTQSLSTQVAGASEEAASSIQSVATATEQLSTSVGEIGRRARESNRIADAAVTQAQETDGRIGELSRAAQQIGDVVKLITAIAEQTNLLALNATIEAARAGDAGRGFAVVAAEVKSLANQTAKATDEISNHIAGMQEATAESVAAIKDIGATIGQISTIAAAIAEAVEQQGAATHEIARSVQGVAAGTQDAAANVMKVNRGATETGSASAQVLNSARALSGESTRLRSELGRFMANIRAA